MKVFCRRPLPPIIAVTAAVMIAGCPLPFEYNGPGGGNSHSSDPSTPSMTAPVIVSYSEQGGTSGTIADGSAFVSGRSTTVTLSTATENAVIYYYIDGGSPLTNLGSAKKTSGSSGTITLTRTTSPQSLDIRAIAIGSNMLPSPAVHATVSVSPYPILSVSRDKASVSEDGGTAAFTITSSSAPTSNITVRLLAGGDYQTNYLTGLPAPGTPFTATLNQAATTVTFPIAVQPDPDGINNSVSLSIQPDSNTPPAYTVGASASATMVIQDNHSPVLTLSASASPISDNGAVTVFTVTSSFPLTSDLTVRLLTGGAYKASDVTGMPGPGSSFALTLPTGATTVSTPVTTHPDIGEYLNETVTVSLVADPAYTIGSPGSATVTILDTSPVGTLTLSADRALMVDGQSATFTVSTSVAPEANLVVNLASNGYTAGKVVVPTAVTIPSGSLSATFVVTTPSEVGYPEQNPQVLLAPGSGYTIGSPGSQSLLITDTAYGFTGLWDFAGGSLSSSVSGASPWVLTGNVSIVGGSLSLPGNYRADYAQNDVSNVINQNQFTLGVSFRMADLSTTRAIVVGGSYYRWLVLKSDTAGNLSLDLNNHDVPIDLGSFVITPGTDHTLLVSIDTTSRSVVARLDGVQFSTSLPPAFTSWNNPPGSDLSLWSEDLSTGRVFAGLWHWIYVATGILN